MRILVSLIILLGVIVSTGCQLSPIDAGTPMQIISSPTTPIPTASERLTGNPTQTLSPSFTVVPIPAYNPENVPGTPTMNEVPISTPFDSGLEKIVTQAKEDLAQRLAVDPEHIELVEVASATWPDGSLGCGTPGTEYLQVVTPGFQILLMADGQIYNYHTDTKNQIILCLEKPPIRSRPTP